jgi:hypothetical protein
MNLQDRISLYEAQSKSFRNMAMYEKVKEAYVRAMRAEHTLADLRDSPIVDRELPVIRQLSSELSLLSTSIMSICTFLGLDPVDFIQSQN